MSVIEAPVAIGDVPVTTTASLVLTVGYDGFIFNSGQAEVYLGTTSAVTSTSYTYRLGKDPSGARPLGVMVGAGTWYAITASGKSSVQTVNFPSTGGGGGVSGPPNVGLPVGSSAVDTAVVQAALNGSGTFFLAEGTYVCGPLTLPAGAHLEGVNSGNNGFTLPNRTVLKADPTLTWTGPFLDFPIHDSGQILRDIEIDVSAVATGITYAVNLDNYSTGGGEEWQGVFDNVYINAGTTAAGPMYVGNNRRGGDFRRVFCSGGADSYNYSTDANWWDCSWANSSGYGVRLLGNTGTLVGCRAFNNATGGVLAAGQINFVGGSYDTNPVGVYISGVYQCTFNGVSFTNNSSIDVQCAASITPATAPTFSGCFFYQSGANTPGHNITTPAGTQAVEFGNYVAANAFSTAHSSPPSMATLLNGATIDLCQAYGAVPGVDITAMVQAAINVAAASALATLVIKLSVPGTYLLSGAQQTGTAFTYAYSGQLLMPASSTGLVVILEGVSQAFGPVDTTSGALVGTALLSNATSGAVIDGIPSNDTTYPQTNVRLVLRNIQLIVPNNPQCHGINAATLQALQFEGFNAITANSDTPTTPSHTTCGVIFPPVDADADQLVMGTLLVEGFNVGIKHSEHFVNAGRVYIQTCNIGFQIYGNKGATTPRHLVNYGHILIQGTPTGIQAVASGTYADGYAGGVISGRIDVGDPYNGAALTYAVDDSSNVLLGRLEVSIFEGTGAVPVNGAGKLKIVSLNSTSDSNVLGFCHYTAGSAYAITTTTAGTAVDSTNLSFSFVAPPSGDVEVSGTMFIQQTSSGSAALDISLVTHGGTTQVVTSKRPPQLQTSGNVIQEDWMVMWIVTGLTPGTTYHWDVAAWLTGALTTASIGATLGPTDIVARAM